MFSSRSIVQIEPQSRGASTGNPTKNRRLRLVALVCLLIFLATGFRAGFLRDETDFPNYHTAAVLIRKHEPLRQFYDWTWFAREMDRAGLGTRIGSYTPQTPLTMLPMIGLAGLSLQRAKQVWLILNLFFLASALWMLSQITRWRLEHLWLLTFCSYYSLNSNFILGQYYVFLLFLLTLTLYLLHHTRLMSAGIAMGLSFVLKLYGGPFLLYFIAVRKWKSVAGMFIAIAAATALAVGLFGWADVRYYAHCLLPRFLEGGAVDPYNVGNQTMPTLLGICFMVDPGLNPHPLWNAPWVFFFTRTCFSLAILVLLYLGTSKTKNPAADFGWCVVAVLLLSTNLSSYTFILMLLPAVLLFDRLRPVRSTYLAISCLLLVLPLHKPWLFPKLWLLLGMFMVFGWERWRRLSARSLAWGAAGVVVCAALISWGRIQTFREEPGRNAQQLAVSRSSLFSSFPVSTSSGLFFQSMAADRYVVSWWHDSQLEQIRLNGNAFHPIPSVDGLSIAIEESTGGSSRTVRFDPVSRQLTDIESPLPTADVLPSATSPDGKWLAYTSDDAGFQHLWLRNLVSGKRMRLAGGNCDSSWPAWNLDSRSIVFASDCGRAVGLPALYQVPVPAP